MKINRVNSWLHKSSRFYSSATLPQTTDVVVIGGGVVGASTAYHLAKRGLQVTLLERHKLTSGTTWHSAAMMNSIRGNVHEGELVHYTKHLVSSGELEAETGVSPGWKRHGGLSITNNEDQLKEFKVWDTLGKFMSWDSKIVDPQEIKYLHPLINTDGLAGGIYVPSDGSIDPTGLTNALAKGAKLNGATILEDCPVSSINVNSSNAIQSVNVGRNKIYTNKVVLAAGAWSKDLAKKIGREVPTMANKHSYVVSDIIPGISSYPNVRHYDHNLYFKVHNDTIFMGAFEENPTFVEVDPDLVFGLYDFEWDVYEPYLKKHMEIMPTLGQVGQKTIICGPESFTPDYMPLFGPDSEVTGLYYNCGMSSRGIQLSGGMGREMANLIVSGKPSIDMFMYDINRFHSSYISNRRWQEETIHEGEVRTYWVKYPTLQRMAGRNLHHSPFHAQLMSQGAFFGSAGGIERPLFFLAQPGLNLSVPQYDFYGYYGHKRVKSTYESLMRNEYAQWAYTARVSNAIRAEVKACREDVALFDLSSFGKVMISGSDALPALDWLCTAPMDNAVGISKYSLMLNEAGGIEADVTVTRVGPEEFYIVTGAAFTQYLVASLKRRLKDRFYNASIKDVTQAFAILSIQGPQSQAYLGQICSSEAHLADLKALQYGQSAQIQLLASSGQLCSVRAIRMSYVGELGYELHISNQDPAIQDLFDTLVNLPQGGMTLAGFEALNAMSLEKGHKHWHGDIETTDLPKEAGLMFACSSPSNFVGKSALKNAPMRKMLATFTTSPEVALNGNEVIYRNGVVVGYLRRGGFAYTINKSLGTGYVTLPEVFETPRDFVLKGRYQIDVMGTKHEAEVSLKALYDPERRKMK